MTLGQQAVWPTISQPSGCMAVENAAHTQVTWPTWPAGVVGPTNPAGGLGAVLLGPPPGGDFVPSGAAGLSYVTPGHQ